MAPARTLVEGLATALLFAGITYVLTYPLFADPSRTLFDPSLRGPLSVFALGDMYTVMWVMSWATHALTTAGTSLFDANIFHPAPHALTSTEHMLGHLPVFAPVYLLSDNPVLANQWNLLFGFVLSGVAMYALLRHWGCHVAPSIGGGLIFAFVPLRLQFVTHPHLVQGGYAVFALLAFDQLLATGRKRWALALALALGLQCLCSFYLAYMTLTAVGAYAACALIWRGNSLGRGWWLAAVSGIVGLLPFLFAAWPYLGGRESGQLPAQQEHALLRYLSVDVGRLIAVRAEGYYAGASVILLAFVGCLRPSGPAWARAGAVAIVFACLGLALGPSPVESGWSMPYDLASSLVPGFSAMRAPSRYVLFLMLGASALAGLGLEAIYAFAQRGRPLVAVVAVAAAIAVVGWDYGWAGRAFPVRDAEVAENLPPVYRALRGLPPGVVVELPAGGRGLPLEQERDSLYTYRSVFHWRPLLNGRAGYEPPTYGPVMALARALPDPLALSLLQRTTGLRYVIQHSIAGDPLGSGAGLRELGRYGGATLYEVARRGPADLQEALVDFGAQSTVTGATLRSLSAEERFADVVVAERNVEVEPGSLLPLDVSVLNRGESVWPVLTVKDRYRVALGCRWYRDGEVMLEQPAGGWLPYDVAPGAVVDGQLACVAELPPDRYVVEVGVMQDGVWFDGTDSLVVRIRG